MSHANTLKSLEIILESFLDRAVRLKESRLQVLSGMNRLDDIARSIRQTGPGEASAMTDRIGGWFAEHRNWLHDQTLRTGDRNRLDSILGDIRRHMDPAPEASPAGHKIAGEIVRWQNRLKQPIPESPTRPVSPMPPTAGFTRPKPGKIVLRRPGESLDEAGVHPSGEDSISLFAGSLDQITNIFKDMAGRGPHLMSVLDDTLKTATVQKNRQALLLSALIIYYLKQNGYMVQPFVKRLRQAEQLQNEGGKHA